MGQHRFEGARLQADVEHYCAFGDHRTAWEADFRTVSWLKVRLRDLGYETLRQPFQVRQFFVRKCRLQASGQRLKPVPLWFPVATGREPLTAALAAADEGGDLAGRLALMRLPPGKGALERELEERILDVADQGAAGVIAVSSHPDGEPVALNVEGDPEPWPLPVVSVGERDLPALEAATENGSEVELVLDGEWRAVSAKNTVAQRNGHGPAIVISTPISGWFRCGGERGPGIALALALAEWAAAEDLPCMVVGTSGHELGGLGMKAFLDEQAPHPDDVDCWLHLGAGFAARDWADGPSGPEPLPSPTPRRLLMASEDLAEAVPPAFRGHAGLETVSDRVVGEMAMVLDEDYRAFGLAGGHRYHHTPADGPEMTGPEILAPMADALIEALELALE